MTCLPRSPDLTPLDFYLWGQMKNMVYDTPVQSEMYLVSRIAVAAGYRSGSKNDVSLARVSSEEVSVVH